MLRGPEDFGGEVEDYNEPSQSRREFLRFAAGTVAGATLLGKITPKLFEGVASAAGNEKNDDSHITRVFKRLHARGDKLAHHRFKAGETIPWPVPVHIGHDWTMTLRPADAKRFLKSLNLQSADIEVTTSNTVDIPEYDPENGFIYIADYTPVPKKPAVWHVRPLCTTEIEPLAHNYDKIRFNVRGPDTFKKYGVSKHHNYHLQVPYQLEWYSGRQKKQGLIDPNLETCVSEQRLNPAQYEQVDSLVKLFRKFTPNKKPVAIISKPFKLKDPGNDPSMYTATSGILFISGNDLRDPSDTKLVVGHELGHSIHQSLKAVAPESRAIKKLNEAYSHALGLIRRSDPRHKPVESVFADPCSPAYLRIFQDFDESTYDTKLVCNVGHPSDNPSEIFASGLNVLRINPGHFRQMFRELGPIEQHLVRDVIQAILGVLQEAMVINHTQSKYLDTLVPHWREIAQL